MSNKEKKLGDILIDGGFITPLELDEALQRQKLSDKMLGEILVAGNFIDREELVRALQIQMGEIFQSSKSPVISINIESVYGLYSASREGSLDSIAFCRKENETNEAIAERAATAIKEMLLKLLANENDRKQFEKSELDIESPFDELPYDPPGVLDEHPQQLFGPHDWDFKSRDLVSRCLFCGAFMIAGDHCPSEYHSANGEKIDRDSPCPGNPLTPTPTN